jgi:DNA-binding response OmpR family regulator
LRRYGFEVLTAASGEQCLEWLLATAIDLVVLDLRMPGIDGLDLLARIRGHSRTLPVVINTAFSSYTDNYLTWSADAFVVKSSDLSELVATVCDLARPDR